VEEDLSLMGGGEVAQAPRLGERTKEGATGAAIIASGLAGGRFTWVVEALRLRESRGSIFDHVALSPETPRLLKAEFSRCL
jgi:predicted butyrate kinase (DUF1464 family)